MAIEALIIVTNTGHKEATLAQLNQILMKTLRSTASTFNSQAGILRGSQIANTTDLYYSIRVDTPTFTSFQHSYTIGAQTQRVCIFKVKL